MGHHGYLGGCPHPICHCAQDTFRGDHPCPQPPLRTAQGQRARQTVDPKDQGGGTTLRCPCDRPYHLGTRWTLLQFRGQRHPINFATMTEKNRMYDPETGETEDHDPRDYPDGFDPDLYGL